MTAHRSALPPAMTRGDSDIIKGVDQFYNEYFGNALKQFLDGKKELSKLKPEKSTSTTQVVAEEPPSEEELQAMMENQPG